MGFHVTMKWVSRRQRNGFPRDNEMDLHDEMDFHVKMKWFQ